MSKTKLYSSTMLGAPVLNGVAGSMVALLDAVLVSGFGTTTVVSITVASGVATVAFSAGHSFIANSVGLFAGATPTTLNGLKRIVSVATNSVTFSAAGIADGTATGTLTTKVAPAGWLKSFSGTNLASYKMNDLEGTGFSLRVDDTGTTACRVRAYETMTDVSTGTGPFPTLAQHASVPGMFWSKSNAANADARAWYILADSRGFYLFVNNYGASSAFQSYYFGDVLSLKSNDPYACVLRANAGDSSNSSNMITDDLAYADGSLQFGGMYVARAANTLGGSVQAFSCPTLTVGLPLVHTIGGQGWAYPSAVDNGLILGSLVLVSPGTGYRGYFPGLRTSPQYVGVSFSTGEYVVGTGVAAGKRVMVIKFGSTTPGGSQGVLFMDPISDWRV